MGLLEIEVGEGGGGRFYGGFYAGVNELNLNCGIVEAFEDGTGVVCFQHYGAHGTV